MHTSIEGSLSFKPLAASFGAEVVGLDPQHLTAADRQALREAWNRYHVLVVRSTPLTEEQEIDFARSFGTIRTEVPGSGFSSAFTSRPEIMVISNIRENGKLQGLLPDGEMDWHFDGLHQPAPYFGAVLHAIEVPTNGGETKFTNMCAVYRSLPEQTRTLLDGLQAVGSYDYTATTRDSNAKNAPQSSAVHPMVRVHEDSGEQALYVCRLMTERVVGWSEAASRELLESLFAHIDTFGERYEHTWRPGDTVVWDNRCVTHARNDFDGSERRLLKRVTIVGP